MKRRALFCLCLGLALPPLAVMAQEPAPPAGPYEATCRDIRVKRDKIVATLTAICEPSRKETSIPLPCVGEVVNRDGELVCRPRAAGAAATAEPKLAPPASSKKGNR